MTKVKNNFSLPMALVSKKNRLAHGLPCILSSSVFGVNAFNVSYFLPFCQHILEFTETVDTGKSTRVRHENGPIICC